MASLSFDATELKIFYGNLGSPSNPNLQYERFETFLATRHRTLYLRTKLYKISDKSQNVHTADLGYLGFQDYHKKFSDL